MFAAGSISEYLRLDATDRIVNVLPFAFDYGLYQLLMTIFMSRAKTEVLAMMCLTRSARP